MKKITLLFLTVTISHAIMAQNIKGIVSGHSSSGGKTPLAYASISWHHTTIAVTADENGHFTITAPPAFPAHLIASFVGYESDTLTVTAAMDSLDITLHEGAALDEIVVTGRQAGNYISRLATIKTEVISAAGLTKMACCNLAESFENSAGITVGYSDAVSGARQIRLLGLSGNYVQMLDESRPDMRGLAQPFGLSYTPGQWLESIQIAKGAGSILQGYENITGQINLEYRKPATPQPLFLNLYLDRFLRTEANAASSLQLSDKWSTVLLAHASTDPKKYDDNHDGFMDEPVKRQINLANRWTYLADNGTQLRFGVKGLCEKRESGQMDFDGSRPHDTTAYGSQIENKHFNAYVKVGIPLSAAQPREDLGAVPTTSNIAFIGDYTFHELSSFFGLKNYYGRENTATFNTLFQSGFGQYHSYTAGLSFRWDDYGEQLEDAWLDENRQQYDNTIHLSRREITGGLFGEYTFSYKEKLTLVAGLRADYHSLYRWLFTPRVTLKYDFSGRLVFRASAGRGFRTANVITDNIGILATGRKIQIADDLQLEEAWTFGGSLSWYLPWGYDDNASISVDYFHTGFTNQVLVDAERYLYEPPQDYSTYWIYNLQGKSYSNTFQADFSMQPAERFTLLAAFRYTDAKTAYADGNLRERPLNNRFKALLNLQYATRMNIWTFDVTAQLNGATRLPDLDRNRRSNRYSPVYPLFFAQVTRKFKGIDVYIGCENILNYMQESPILHAGDPYSPLFDSTVIWGPLMGRRIYAGLRYTLFK
ncbi:MAG: TonB-dependent receptor [Prevotellaceae bacterium]|jgi:outer membrane receptor for ferrienterochelin and colicin|nr:TonB-dependent receptor [Prevotellaceae bacterium]